MVGAGRIGRRHAELVANHRHAVLAAVVDCNPDARSVAERLGTTWWLDLGDMLRELRPDAVIIATPNALHVEHATRCLASGAPVLLEKPIATSVADAERIADESERIGVPVLVGQHRRHSPYVAAARALIRDGRLGKVVAASATTLFAKPASYFADAPWRREPGGGPILINLIHDVDVLRILVGEVASVQALTSNAIRGQPVEESVAVALRFVGGAVGTLLLADTAAAPISWEMTAGEDPIYPSYPGRDSYLVAGTQGTLGIPTMRLTLADGPASWHEPMSDTTVAVEPADPLGRQLNHFLDVASGSARPLCDARDAVESLRVTLAIAEAAATSAAVSCAPRRHLDT